MLITLKQVMRILHLSVRPAPLLVGPLNLAMARYRIDSMVRAAAFLALCGQLCWVTEDLICAAIGPALAARGRVVLA